MTGYSNLPSIILVVLISVGFGMFGGFWYNKITSRSAYNAIYQARIDSFDGKILKFTYENGSPRTLSDVSKITIWKNKDKRGSISDLKPDTEIQVAADLLTEKIYAILVLN